MSPDPIGGPRLRLNQGTEIPQLGFGVFQSPPGEVTYRAVRWALDVGYRHIDTAAMYRNEADVGRAVRDSGLGREEVFVTTKMWYSEHGFESARKAASESLDRLGLAYIDLYLIHWPRVSAPPVRRETWRAFEKLREEGVARAIGVSNYTVRHLQEFPGHSKVTPAVDQVEFHPFVYDPGLLAYCKEHRILVEAWSPLTRGRRMDDPAIAEVARAHDRTPAQILLRWGVEHGLIVLPKSVHKERIVENAAIFDFTLRPSEMAKLDALRDDRRVGMWNPAEIP